MNKGIIFGLAMWMEMTAASFGACVETPTGVKLEKDGKTVWAFEIENPECKPFIHPLTLPDGRVITDIRPKDHIWHLGAWFCWKLINGVNYWEPSKGKGVEPEGRTMLREKKIARMGEAAKVSLKLAYAPRKAPESIVLSETREVDFAAPGTNGSYTITVKHHFVAEQAVKLDRTPPYVRGKGAAAVWAGGYAGFAVRLLPLCQAFVTTASCGATAQKAVIDNERSWLDFSDPANGHGLRVTVVKGTPETRFYHWADHRFLSPSVNYRAPIQLKKGETLDLVYTLTIH